MSQGTLYKAEHEFRGRLYAAVKINGGKHRFKGVRQNGGSFSAAHKLLAVTEAEARALLAARGAAADAAELRREIHGIIAQWVVAERLALNAKELDAFVSEVMDEMTGLGPLEPLLKDPSIADILINGHQNIFVERRGLHDDVARLVRRRDAQG